MSEATIAVAATLADDVAVAATVAVDVADSDADALAVAAAVAATAAYIFLQGFAPNLANVHKP